MTFKLNSSWITLEIVFGFR